MPEYEQFFEVKQPEQIQSDAMDALQSDIDKREGSFANDMAAPLSLELHKMYETLRRIRPMVWVDAGSGAFLDLAAEDLGMEPRKAGSRARVMLEIAAAPGYVLPASSVFLTDAGVRFATDTELQIPVDADSATVSATALEAGTSGNVDAHTIVHRQGAGIRVHRVTNPAPAAGGADPETDKSLYARIVFARQRPATSGNRYHYEMWAREVDGIGAVRVFPLWNGNGTVKVLVADEDRQPVDAETVARCAAHIEAMRPTTARVTVLSARPRAVAIAAELRTDGEIPASSKESIRRRVCDGLDAYFRALSLEQDRVTRHEVGARLIRTEGIVDYRRLRLDGERADVLLTPDEIPVLGEVALTWI